MAKMLATDNGGRRAGKERRQTFVAEYTPEKRSGIERRNGQDRRAVRYRNRLAPPLSNAYSLKLGFLTN